MVEFPGRALAHLSWAKPINMSRGAVVFILSVILLVVLCGWLDSRLDWPRLRDGDKA
jgi:hypothetical protein